MGLRVVARENDGAEECSNLDGIKNVITSEKFCRIYLKSVVNAIDFNNVSVHGVFLKHLRAYHGGGVRQVAYRKHGCLNRSSGGWEDTQFAVRFDLIFRLESSLVFGLSVG